MLDGLHPVDLYAQVLQALVKRSGIDPGLLEDVITGCVLQVGEQAGNIGRQAVLAAGLPESLPAITLDRKCGSAQQAIDFAAQGVIAGAYDAVVAGGVEMMSLIPMKANRIGRDASGPMLRQRYPDGLVGQGISAELIAARWQLSREALDAFALESQRRAVHAEDAGISTAAIALVRFTAKDGSVRIVERDEGPRRSTTLEALAALKPAFVDAAMAARFPEIDWRVTAGNSSQITDGACAALIVEERTAERLGLTAKAAISGFAVVGDDPLLMLTGIMPATRKLLARKKLRLDQIDVFEVNEAFASVTLAWIKEFKVDPVKVNAYGGAIALGHPVGASGGRLFANLVEHLQRSGGRYGLQTMCESGGMANATLIERL
jgi:acetyl-CoA acyltransferase